MIKMIWYEKIKLKDIIYNKSYILYNISFILYIILKKINNILHIINYINNNIYNI